MFQWLGAATAFTAAGQVRTVVKGAGAIAVTYLLFNTDEVLTTVEAMIALSGVTAVDASALLL